ncbi:MAG: tandem-95 repeat protein [Desulfobulbaceae bacterium]|nr:tandem-95 repeat protein [Desulfobulbaceae bacterium]
MEKDGVFTFIAEANYHGSVALSYTARNDQGEEIAGVLNIAIAACDDATEFGTNEFVTDEETPLSIEAWTLLDAARDADGGLRFVGVGAAAHGAVAVDENGGIVFRPEANYFGEEAGFSYTLQDADGKLSENFAKIVVENVDDVPEIIADSLTINEDESLAFTPEVIGQFLRDSDGDTLLLTSLTINAPPSPPAPLPQAGEGSEELSAPLPQAGEASELAAAGAAIGVVVEKDGVFTFIPDENYSGSAALSYTAKNDKGEEISGVLNIAIAARDDATEFGLDRYDTAEEQAIILQPETLLENDHDADGALHFLGLGLTKFGTAILNDAGTIEFTPDKDYFGDEAGFFYQVQDEAGNVSESWVKITVENLNDRPEIIGDMLYLHEDQALSLTSAVLSQFLFDADGDEFHLASVSAATGGQFEEKDGIFTFIPEANYYGQAAFSYIAANESGAELVGTMTLVINPINDAPEAQITELTGLEDTEITVNIAELLAGASDIEDGDFKSGNIHFAGIDQTIHGDAWLDDDGVLHFQAEDNFSGQALLRYRVADSEGDEGFGYVKYEITGLQDAPVAVDDSLNAWSNAGYENVFQSSIFLQNDYDADGDKLSILSISAAAFGQVSLDAEGKIHYSAPATNWIGVDSFTYTIADGHGGESVAQVQFEVKANTAPDLQSEIIFSVEDIWSKIAADDLLKNDYDIDGDNLKIIKVDGAEHCQVALQADGSVKFTPDAHYNNNYPGPASFRYTVSDGVSAPVSALAYVSLSPVNDAPIVVSEELSGAVEDNYFVFHINQLTANDYDVETVSIYEEDAIILSGIWSAEYGTISWDAVSGWVYYTPDANFHGLDSFQYQIVDSEGEQDVAYSYIYVQPVNDKPFAEWDYGSPAEEEIENRYVLHGENGRGLLDNDIDIDGDVLKISGTPTVISNNAKAWLSSGDLVVLPNQGAGQVVVEYTVSDGHGGDSKSRLIIHDTPEHNSPPELVDCSAWLKSSHWVSDGYVFECTVVFNLQFMDKNGWEDIVSIDICPLETGPYSGYKKIGASSFEVQFSGDSDRGSYLPMMQFTVTATDSKNATGTVLVSFGGAAISSSQCYYGADLADLVRAHPAYSPVALDLDGDGIELLGVEAGTLFDWNGDGVAEKTGWLAVDDGFLAYDFDGDGRIAHSKEISFRDYVPGATTDLQGLAYFDDDHNGFLDPGDGQWSSFGVWRDLDGDGLSGDGEFSGLDQLGITSLHLNSDHNVSMENGNIVHGLTTYTTVDGASHIAADVGLIGAEIELVMAEDEKAADGAAEAKELIDTSCHDADEASAANPSGPGQSLAEAGSFSEKYSSQDVASSSEKSSDQDENALAAAPSSNDNVTDFANSDQTPAEAATVAPAFDEATLNNLAAQLASDMAASTWGEERLTPGPDFAAGDAGDCADDFFLHHHGLVIG